jgi:hypothetical protein
MTVSSPLRYSAVCEPLAMVRSAKLIKPIQIFIFKSCGFVFIVMPLSSVLIGDRAVPVVLRHGASERQRNPEYAQNGYVRTNRPYSLLERLIGEYVGRMAEARKLAH